MLGPVAVGTAVQVIGLGVGGVVSGGSVVADCVLDQPVSFGVVALSRTLTLNEYKVPASRLKATYVVLDCQLLLLLPSVVHSKRYSTGGLSASVAVVAVIVIVLGPVAVGTEDQVIGSGVGGVVSGGLVVADSVLDQPVSFRAGELSLALTLNEYIVPASRPVATYVVLDCQPLVLLPSVVHSK